MKKTLLFIFLAFACAFSVSAQKKTNGTIYIEHPALSVVNDFCNAFIAGDEAKMASLLTDDFKAYDGTSNQSDGGAIDKKTFLNEAASFKNQFDYFSFVDFPGSYPDALEYQKDNKDKMITVLSWKMLNGVHKKTGVKIDASAHYSFAVTADGKIKRMISYENSKVFNEIRASLTTRTNGTIYNHHENINTVRKSMYAFEKGDVDKALSYFTKDAKFFDINNTPYDKADNMETTRTNWLKFVNDFQIVSIEEVGYPDYLHYEMGDTRVVLSWWKFNLIRKSDKKKLTVGYHFSDEFNADGKIISEMAYYGIENFKK